MKKFWQIHALAQGEAEILIYEFIGENFFADDGGLTAKRFAKELKALGEIRKLSVRINSPGGNVFHGNAIYNILQAHSAEITVHIDGLAASIASVIAMAGDTIIMPENSIIMIHDPSGIVVGTSNDMRKMAEALDKVKTGMVAAYRNKSGLDDEEIARLMTEESWLTAEEAVDMGLVDQLAEPVRMAAHFDLSNFRNVPDLLKQLNAGLPGNGGIKMKTYNLEEITAAMILAELPAVAVELRDEMITKAEVDAALATAKAEGATAERDRIKAVETQLMPGHEALINTLKYDGKTTGPEAAVQVLNAEKRAKAGKLADAETDAATLAGVNSTVSPQGDLGQPGAGIDGRPVEERCKEKWEKDEKIRGEFTDLAAYTAYTRAAEKGTVKILGKE